MTGGTLAVTQSVSQWPKFSYIIIDWVLLLLFLCSWELSDMMQTKVKQRMARQKIGLEAASDQFAGLKIASLFLLCLVCFFVLGPSACFRVRADWSDLS